MKSQRFVKIAAGAAIALGAIVVAQAFRNTPRVRAEDDDHEESLVRRGFEIAPVPLNLKGKDRRLVGLGSFIVNAQADCNGCHTGGGPPNFNYAPGGNPYFGQPTVVNPDVYLSGGMPFPQVGTPTGPKGYAGPAIVSRNLTPDKSGRPEGGSSFQEFKQILRHGTDFDHLHPVCSAAQIDEIQQGQTPNCIPTSPDNPVDGNLLQIMPWPVYHNMTDQQIRAIYEYLSAIPCIVNPAADPPHDCG
jgi:hypothetical protein